VEEKRRPTGKKESPNYVKYGTAEGQLEFGHLHLGTEGELESDVTSGVMLQAYDSRHYMTMDIDGVRKGWTLNRSPGPTQTICASDDAGIVGNEKGIGYFLLSENGDIVIRAPKGRIRLSALDIDIRADGTDNTRGTINLDSNQSVNVKTGTFDVHANGGARIFTTKTLNLVGNTSLHIVGNFVNAFSSATSTLPNKAFELSTVEFNTKSNYA
jgi:hypothetical protein